MKQNRDTVGESPNTDAPSNREGLRLSPRDVLISISVLHLGDPSWIPGDWDELCIEV